MLCRRTPVFSPPIVSAGWQKTKFPESQRVYEPSFIVVRIFTVLQRVSYFLSVIFCCTFFTRLKNSFTARLGSLYHLLSAKERERESLKF